MRQAAVLLTVLWASLVTGGVSRADDADLNARVAKVQIGLSTLDGVIKQLGEPKRYLWESQRYTRANLPHTYIMEYDGGGLSLVVSRGKVTEVRVTDPGYLLAGKVRVGSSPDEVFATLGKPKKTVERQPLPQRAEDGVFYKDLDGREGSGYLAVPARGVRLFFDKNAVSAIYLTRNQAPVRQAAPPPAAKAVPATQFLEHLAAGRLDRAGETLDPTMRAAVTDEQLGQIWRDLVAKFGVFEAQTGIRTSREAGYDVAHVGCEFARGSVIFRVVTGSEGKVAGFFIASTGPKGATRQADKEPDYVDRASFTEVPVTFGRAPWALPGTLALPKAGRPCPAVILVHGSGPLDRDETVGPNKPFRDLAGGLASRGIAVLRYDKRTHAHKLQMALSQGSLTVKEEVIDDVLAAASLLRGRTEIDPSRVYVLGHSLGGMLVPRIAAAINSSGGAPVAGYVVMAGPTRPLEDLMVEQVNYITGLDGTVTPDEAAVVATMRDAAAKVKALDAATSAATTELIAGAPPAYWLDLKGYDPAAVAAEHLKAPLLILQGGRDYQVTPGELAGWRDRLGKRADVLIKEYPALNHLFIRGEGTPGPAEYQFPGHVSGDVVRDIADWIGKQQPPPKSAS